MSNVVNMSDVVRFKKIRFQDELAGEPGFEAALNFNDAGRAGELAVGLGETTIHAGLAHACVRSNAEMFARLLENVKPNLRILFRGPHTGGAEEFDLAEMAAEAFGTDVPGGFWEKVDGEDAALSYARAQTGSKKGDFRHGLFRRPEMIADLATKSGGLATRAMFLIDGDRKSLFVRAMESEVLDDAGKLALADIFLARANANKNWFLAEALPWLKAGPVADRLAGEVSFVFGDGQPAEDTGAVYFFQMDPGVFRAVMGKVDWTDERFWDGLGEVLSLSAVNSRGCQQTVNLTALTLDMAERAGEGKMSFVREGGGEGLSLYTFILMNAALFDRVADKIDFTDPVIRSETEAAGYGPYLDRMGTARAPAKQAAPRKV